MKQRILSGLVVFGFFILSNLPQIPLSIFSLQASELNQPFSLTKSLVTVALFCISLGIFLWYARKKGFVSWKGLDLKLALKVLLLGYLATMIFNAIGATLISLKGEETTFNQAAIEGMVGIVPLPVLFMMIVVGAPVMEELLFRVFVPKLLFKNEIVGLAIGALIFCLLHSPKDLGSWIIYGGMGVVMATVAYRTKRVEYAILLHLLINSIGFVVMADRKSVV